MNSVFCEDNLASENEISPKDLLVQEIEEIKLEKQKIESATPGALAGFAIEDFDPELIDSLNECEVAMFLAGVRSIIPATNIYNAYANETNYTDWKTFWKSQEYEVLRLVDGLWDALRYIPEDERYAHHRKFLELTILDFLAGRGRAESLAEKVWYDLPHDICRIDVRLSPQIEQGVESYIHPEREKGGNPTATVRYVLGDLTPEQKTVEAKIIESAIAEYLGAEDLLEGYRSGYREDFVLARGAMHGVSRSTAHQYKRIGADGNNRVQFISNINMQLLNREEYLKRIDRFFGPGLLEEMRANLLDDSMEFRYGHEVCELLIEHKYSDRTKAREGTELEATIGTMEAVRRKIVEKGDMCDRLYEKMMKSFVSGYFDLISREPYDKKLEPYIRGDVAALKRLRAGGAVIYGEDNKVISIDRAKFEEVMSTLAVELLRIIVEGDTEAYNILFELPHVA